MNDDVSNGFLTKQCQHRAMSCKITTDSKRIEVDPCKKHLTSMSETRTGTRVGR